MWIVVDLLLDIGLKYVYLVWKLFFINFFGIQSKLLSLHQLIYLIVLCLEINPSFIYFFDQMVDSINLFLESAVLILVNWVLLKRQAFLLKLVLGQVGFIGILFINSLINIVKWYSIWFEELFNLVLIWLRFSKDIIEEVIKLIMMIFVRIV